MWVAVQVNANNNILTDSSRFSGLTVLSEALVVPTTKYGRLIMLATIATHKKGSLRSDGII